MSAERLTATSAFTAWVANTVHSVSGIRPDFSGLDGECLLTFVLTRMPACQVPAKQNFAGDFQASMRFAAIVTTNQCTLH